MHRQTTGLHRAPRRPIYVALDLLIAEGVDLRPLPLRRRKRVAEGAEGWVALTNSVIGEDQALYRAVVDADLDAIVAKHLADACQPKFTRDTRCSIGLTRSVAVAPSGFASTADVMPDTGQNRASSLSLRSPPCASRVYAMPMSDDDVVQQRRQQPQRACELPRRRRAGPLFSSSSHSMCSDGQSSIASFTVTPGFASLDRIPPTRLSPAPVVRGYAAAHQAV